MRSSDLVKIVLQGVLVLGFASGCLVAGDVPEGAKPMTNQIVAVVNGEPITMFDVDQDARALEEAYGKICHGDELQRKIGALRKETLRNLIDRRLIIQSFRSQGGWTPESYLDQQVQKAVKDYYQGDADRLTRALAVYGETLDDFKNTIDDKAIVAFMTKKNVDDKLILTVPANADKDRSLLSEAWMSSLRKAADIEITW